jgi:hypothetical protein
MKQLLLSLMLLASCTPAPAESLVARTPSTTLTLTDKPCGEGVKENLREEFRDQFKAAALVLHGKHYTGCWILHEDDKVFVLMENGEAFFSPIRAFKVDQGV